MNTCTKNYFISLGCAALFLVPLTPSKADTLLYTSLTPSTAASFTKDFTLPAFDTNDGTLTGIKLSVDISAHAGVTATGSGFALFVGAMTTGNTLTGPGSLSDSITTAVVLAGFQLTGGSHTDTGTGSSIPSPETITIGSGSFASWEHAGSGALLNLALTANSPVFTKIGTGYTYTNPYSDESGSYTVTYTYTPAVPEPSTLNLLGIMLGLAAVFKAVRFVRSPRLTA